MNKMVTITKHEISQILLKDRVPFDYFIRTNLVGNYDDKTSWKFRTSLVRPIPAPKGKEAERECFFVEDPYMYGNEGFMVIKSNEDKCLEYYLENILEGNKNNSSIA